MILGLGVPSFQHLGSVSPPLPLSQIPPTARPSAPPQKQIPSSQSVSKRQHAAAVQGLRRGRLGVFHFLVRDDVVEVDIRLGEGDGDACGVEFLLHAFRDLGADGEEVGGGGPWPATDVDGGIG